MGPAVGLKLEVPPVVGVVPVPQPASTAEAASATNVLIVRGVAGRVGENRTCLAPGAPCRLLYGVGRRARLVAPHRMSWCDALGERWGRDVGESRGAGLESDARSVRGEADGVIPAAQHHEVEELAVGELGV